MANDLILGHAIGPQNSCVFFCDTSRFAHTGAMRPHWEGRGGGGRGHCTHPRLPALPVPPPPTARSAQPRPDLRLRCADKSSFRVPPPNNSPEIRGGSQTKSRPNHPQDPRSRPPSCTSIDSSSRNLAVSGRPSLSDLFFCPFPFWPPGAPS
jgi:hypothetical protein